MERRMEHLLEEQERLRAEVAKPLRVPPGLQTKMHAQEHEIKRLKNQVADFELYREVTEKSL